MGDVVDIRIAPPRLDRRDEHLAAAMRARDDEPRKRCEFGGRNGVTSHGAILLRAPFPELPASAFFLFLDFALFLSCPIPALIRDSVKRQFWAEGN
jgi:hypothetical protein